MKRNATALPLLRLSSELRNRIWHFTLFSLSLYKQRPLLTLAQVYAHDIPHLHPPASILPISCGTLPAPIQRNCCRIAVLLRHGQPLPRYVASQVVQAQRESVETVRVTRIVTLYLEELCKPHRSVRDVFPNPRWIEMRAEFWEDQASIASKIWGIEGEHVEIIFED